MISLQTILLTKQFEIFTVVQKDISYAFSGDRIK